ncbi:hypothetical protein [Flavobacterium sp. N2038]|uniref:hypothetical protein n=1 Tax=Flavobacterium sp. N2038 TaxID=2986829 RepID=UPI0022253501|nr:hypothetical protein [Flavobacterium sp. N2038]
MRKISSFLILIFIITSCDNKEELTSNNQTLNNPTQTYIINGDIKYESEITDGSKPKKPILVYHIPKITNDSEKLTGKTSEQSVILNFMGGISETTNSGCTIDVYSEYLENHYTTDKGVYGHNPFPLYPRTNEYLIRGYGKPHQNFYYNALVMNASNKGIKRTVSRNNIPVNDNSSKISAISIEYPFKANITYEISLKTFFNDNRKMIDNIQSNGFPILSASLEDTGILFGGITSCENDLKYSATNQNYMRSYTLEDNMAKERIITYKFSPTEVKNALSIMLLPTRGERGTDQKIPTSDYTMVLLTVTIIEKPFDPSINVIRNGGRR